MPGRHWLVYKCSSLCPPGELGQCWGCWEPSQSLLSSTSWSPLSPSPLSPPAGSQTGTWGRVSALVTQLVDSLPENIGRLFETVLDETLESDWRARHHMFLLFPLHWHRGHWNTNISSPLTWTNVSQRYRQPSVWRLDWSWDWWTLDIQTVPHHSRCWISAWGCFVLS